MNPLLQDWDTPFGLPPFSAIATDDFGPAFDAALAEARSNIDAIAGDTAEPDFRNTIEAMERAERSLDRVAAVFFGLAGAHTNDAIEALQRELSPRLAAHHAETTMNAALFARVDGLFVRKAELGLTPEQDRVLTLYHRMFVRAGARLEGAGRTRLKEIVQRLASLGTAFGQNVLAEEKSWALPLGPDDLAGLPADLVAAAAQAATDRGLDGHVVTLSRSLIVPFLQFSPRRDLRERAFRAWTARGRNGGETDNRAIVAEMLALREERARLLGYPDFAHFKLEPEMAGAPEAVRDLLMAVWIPARARAEADGERLGELMRADGINDALGAVGLALLRGDPAGAGARLRRGDAEALPAARQHPRRRLRRRGPAVRAELPPGRGPALPPRRAGLGGPARRAACRRLRRRLLRARIRSGRAPGARRSAARTSSTARCGRSRSTCATSPRRRRDSRAS